MARPTGGRPGPEGNLRWFRALLVIVVLVVIGVVILAKSKSPDHTVATTGTHTTTSTTPPTVPAPTTTTTLVPAAQVKVQVLNGVLRGSLAGEWSTKLKTTYGYVTEPPDNATSAVPASVIYVITPSYTAEAQRLAMQVGLAASAVVTPVPTTAPIPTRDRTTANLVLVIGSDLAASA